MDSDTYSSLKSLYTASPAFSPLVSVGLLPYLAFILLLSTFTLGFYLSTTPKATIPAISSRTLVHGCDWYALRWTYLQSVYMIGVAIMVPTGNWIAEFRLD
ncbi:hypothetical protein MKEN_00606500 [Mycena kentingensis (nom. inval.)]|nr:hypothetical protein MKEN_00606500 [Mycena kentingensis (nom. inval.)]